MAGPRPVLALLHRHAPPKPAPGAPCNGCGVCCAAETCPLGRLRFLKIRGPCPALYWQDDAARYTCQLLSRSTGVTKRWVARWIAAGVGCDCTHEAEPPASG